MEQYDKEVAAPTSCCYCIIPWPCPPGKGPRTPLVTYLLDGKYLASLGFYLQPAKPRLEAGV
jgi:hypothetical protein